MLRIARGFAIFAILFCGTLSAQESSTILVFVNGNAGANLASTYHLTPLGPLVGDPNILRFEAASPAAAIAARNLLATDGRVRQAHVQKNIQYQTLAFMPNDPFYFPGPDPGVGGGSSSTADLNFPGQWHLRNQMPASGLNDPTIDARLLGAWTRDLTGAGVTVGIIDDSVQVSHPDLSPNNIAALSRYFLSDGSSSANPDPPAGSPSSNRHGTSVAGVAAARGNNSLGGTGAAPFAGLAGIRTNLNTTALSNSYTWNNALIHVKNHSYGAITPFDEDSALTSVLSTTVAATIHVFAAGNSRGTTLEDANKLDLQNTSGIITVAALGSDGRFADYSNYGANVFVTAPSNSATAFIGITTTDRTGNNGYNQSSPPGNFASTAGGGTGRDYTTNFGGTSSAAPLVTGILALAVQTRNNAGLPTNARIIQHLIVRTARQVDIADASTTGGWITNAAGIKHNQNYGFGLIDADALTLEAPNWSNVTPQGSFNSNSAAVVGIPDNSVAGVTRTINVAGVGKLEDVLVTLNISHTNRGELTARLTSPAGTTSRLFNTSSETSNNINWEFQTVAFWGEDVTGDWILTVADTSPTVLGDWNSFSAIFHTGELIPVPEPALLGLVLCGLMIYRSRNPHAPFADSRRG